MLQFIITQQLVDEEELNYFCNVKHATPDCSLAAEPLSSGGIRKDFQTDRVTQILTILAFIC